MKLVSMIKRDMIEGVIRAWPKYGIAFCLFSLFAAVQYLSMTPFSEDAAHSLSVGDYSVGMFLGMQEYDPGNFERFDFPAQWMLIVLLLAYITLHYPCKDLNGIGAHLMLASGSRFLWWTAKCVWVVLSVTIYILSALAGICSWVLASGGLFTFEVSATVPFLLNFDKGLLLPSPWDLAPFLICLWLTMIALCTVQMVLSLLLRPIISYLCTASLLLFSAYFQQSFLIGNYLMAARSGQFVLYGMNALWGSLIALFTIAVFALMGSMVFKGKDILIRST